MTEQEYKDFLVYLFSEYAESKIRRLFRGLHPIERHHEFDWEFRRLREAMNVINYVKHNCDSDDEIYETFRMEILGSTVRSVRSGVRTSSNMAKRSGFLDAIDDHFEEIIDGIKPEYFPKEELEVLQKLGSKNPQIELAGIIYLLKAKQSQLASLIREVRISKQLDRIEEMLLKAEERFEEESKEEEEKPRGPGRRWFKGLGQIAQGAALSIANIALAAEFLPFPVSAETKTWGAMTSTTAGFGMVLTGVGELRNE